MLDLTKSRKNFVKKGKYQFEFTYDLDDYTLPSTIKHMIYERMSHLSEKNYHYLQKLSLVQTPLSKSLIRHILGLSDTELFALLQGGKDNEILREDGKYFYFTFLEAKRTFYG